MRFLAICLVLASVLLGGCASNRPRGSAQYHTKEFQVKEGTFILKKGALRPIPWGVAFSAKVTNETTEEWKQVSFNIDVQDASGISLGKTTVWVNDIKPGETKAIVPSGDPTGVWIPTISESEVRRIAQIGITYKDATLPEIIKIRNKHFAKSGNGSIRGTVTYFYNRHQGNKADIGAKVYLLTGKSLALSMSNQYWSFLGDEIKVGGKRYPVYKKTTVDGSGNYEIQGLPSANYILVIKSKNTNGRATRDMLGKIYAKKVVIKSGVRSDQSHDFGVTHSM